jgi:hypothetical protein
MEECYSISFSTEIVSSIHKLVHQEHFEIVTELLDCHKIKPVGHCSMARTKTRHRHTFCGRAPRQQ